MRKGLTVRIIYENLTLLEGIRFIGRKKIFDIADENYSNITHYRIDNNSGYWYSKEMLIFHKTKKL